jgi:hypothetical protein
MRQAGDRLRPGPPVIGPHLRSSINLAADLESAPCSPSASASAASTARTGKPRSFGLDSCTGPLSIFFVVDPLRHMRSPATCGSHGHGAGVMTKRRAVPTTATALSALTFPSPRFGRPVRFFIFTQVMGRLAGGTGNSRLGAARLGCQS